MPAAGPGVCERGAGAAGGKDGEECGEVRGIERGPGVGGTIQGAAGES